METKDLLQQLKGGLIVSCQALPEEPLFGSETMVKMAKAAHMGGASGIRANTKADITAIKQAVDLPVIGLIKKVYPGTDVYITPTKREIDQLIEIGTEIIAIDATNRKRLHNEDLKDLIAYMKESGKYVMADVSTYQEGMEAIEYGVDCLSTTLSGYTPNSRKLQGPDFELIESLAASSPIPVFGEGRISTPEQARHALNLNAHAVVVGSAITRPQLITKKFVNLLEKEEQYLGRQ